MLKNIFNNLFTYKEKENYNFILPNNSNNINEEEFENGNTTKVFNNLSENLEYVKSKYNMLINSDIKAR